MKREASPRPTWLAWSLCGLGFALAGAAFWMSALVRRPAGYLDDVPWAVAFLTMAVVGALIAARQPRNTVGWIFLAIGVWAAFGYLSFEYTYYSEVRSDGTLPGTRWMYWVASWVWTLMFAGPATFLLLLFPDGRLPSRRWRPFAWFTGAFIALVALSFATGWERDRGFTNPAHLELMKPVLDFTDGYGLLVLLVLVGGSVASLVVRYRRSGPEKRQQIKWFVFGAALLAASFLESAVTELIGLDQSRIVYLIENTITAALFLFLPVSAAIGILKYRLFDIDVVINRTVLFGVLAAVITAVYVGIVVGIGTLVGSRGNVFLSILATAVIAVGFHPFRERARRFANRLVYGKRATPYEVLSEFGERLAGSYATEDVLPRLAHVAGEGIGASRSTVWLHLGSELRPAASSPTGKAKLEPLPVEGEGLPRFGAGERAFEVRHQGELLGALTVAMPPQETLTPTGEKLLQDLAAQAGLILRNVRLIEELRASRQRIVAAQDQERRRLERDIHDGAQQQLVALAVRLNLAHSMARKEAPQVAEMLAALNGETQETLENLRDLARGIYPPLLADKGLAAALESQARKAAIPVIVEPNGIGRYPQEAEAAAYFCVLEALQNAAKYSEATSVAVRLGADDGHLVFEVVDDGRGFDPDATPRGAGLQNMVDRLEALGGTLEVASAPGQGTTVRGRVPVTDR